MTREFSAVKGKELRKRRSWPISRHLNRILLEVFKENNENV
jgi:hypothetical protein